MNIFSLWLYMRREAELQRLAVKAHALWALMSSEQNEKHADYLRGVLADLYARMTEIETKLSINPLNQVLA